jgi:hypothetical protein
MATALVCGGRGFNSAQIVATVLNCIYDDQPFTKLVHGAASGADSHAAAWAAKVGIEVAAYPADWRQYGKAAGPIRNRKMLAVERPDLVIAFPGGPGTADMVRQAKAAGIRVVEIEP